MEEAGEESRVMGLSEGVCEDVRCWDGCTDLYSCRNPLMVPIRFHLPVPSSL